jgi:general L-amino acid transport system permease protein
VVERAVDAELVRSQELLGLEEEVVGATLPDEGALRRAPHKEPTTPAEWVKENLFSTPFNSLLTVVFGLLALFLGFQVIRFVFFTGQWGVFQRNARSYATGRWPLEELWRVWVSIYGAALLAGLSVGMLRIRPQVTRRGIIATALVGAFAVYIFAFAVDTFQVYLLTAVVFATFAAGVAVGRRFGGVLTRPLMIAWILAFPAMMVVFRAFDGVPPRLWGGFVLNVTVALVAIFASFPIGLVLALGRRSTLPVIRYFSIGVIELVRGNPLYILLISGAFVLPLLLPPAMSDIPLIIRAMAIFTLFSSAYVAEVVRGGLQGIHFGQYEASRALGLSYTRMMALVILPQALRNTIPAMISHFISLFKDTSLLAVVGGFTDLLRAGRRASTGLGQAGNSLEALLPAALMFWIVAYSMSRWSQRVEKRVGVGER